MVNANALFIYLWEILACVFIIEFVCQLQVHNLVMQTLIWLSVFHSPERFARYFFFLSQLKLGAPQPRDVFFDHPRSGKQQIQSSISCQHKMILFEKLMTNSAKNLLTFVWFPFFSLTIAWRVRHIVRLWFSYQRNIIWIYHNKNFILQYTLWGHTWISL